MILKQMDFLLKNYRSSFCDLPGFLRIEFQKNLWRSKRAYSFGELNSSWNTRYWQYQYYGTQYQLGYLVPNVPGTPSTKRMVPQYEICHIIISKCLACYLSYVQVISFRLSEAACRGDCYYYLPVVPSTTVLSTTTSQYLLLCGIIIMNSHIRSGLSTVVLVRSTTTITPAVECSSANVKRTSSTPTLVLLPGSKQVYLHNRSRLLVPVLLLLLVASTSLRLLLQYQ